MQKPSFLTISYWSLKGLLYLLCSTVALPVTLMLTYNIYNSYKQDEKIAMQAAYSLAAVTAGNVQVFISDTQQALTTLAKRPQMVQPGCDTVFADFKDLFPRLSNMSRSTPQGYLDCSTLPQPGNKPTYVGEHSWFKKLYREQSFIVGPIVFGPVNRGWISVLAVPLLDAQGRMVGGLQTPIDLLKLRLVPSAEKLPDATVIAIVDSDGKVVARSKDPQKYVGQDMKDFGVVQAVLTQKNGTTKDRGLDGVERLYGFLPIEGTDWYVVAGTDAEVALDSARQAAFGAVLLALAVLFVIINLAIFLANRISKPIQSINDAASQVAQGAITQRAVQGGPLELVKVASQFNTMLDTIASSQQELRESQDRLKLAMEGARQALWQYSITEQTVSFSETWSVIIGGSYQPLTYDVKAFQVLIPAEDLEAINTAFARTFKSDENRFDLESRFMNLRGEQIWIRAQGQVTVRDELGRAVRMVGLMRDITERKVAEAQIQKLAFYDALTELPNRRLLTDRLTQSLAATFRNKKHGALLFIDLDHFKTLNDTLGHFLGDQLLEQVAQRLKTCIRETDTAARLGGDEFVVMLSDLSENSSMAASQAEAVGEKILFSLNQPYRLGEHIRISTPSIGLTLFGGTTQESVEEPLKRADMAMYQAKSAGRNTLRFFDPQMQARVTERLAQERDLRVALQESQFTLFYQAQISGDRSILGAEALIRWQHPQRGLVAPGEFITLAEETGLILPLGQWVMDAACTQLAIWQSQPGFESFTLAVNVSAQQFHQDNFVQDVIDSLNRAKAISTGLKIELTEGVLLNNVEDVIEKMNKLKARGVSFSLDDFGTGYSSLSYLKRLPLDQLKIDQGFVRDILIDPNDAAIAKMVISLASTLNLTVVAEGVETAAQKDFLLANGCITYQGYYFSRPLPLAEFEAFVKSS
jgi:diguanylate cyclase (GGDEF)-like protein/PAS domain S-box-containing protein